jgi:hypothetical protein
MFNFNVLGIHVGWAQPTEQAKWWAVLTLLNGYVSSRDCQMPQAVIFIGVQASGKSTFYMDRFFRTHMRINLDMLHTRNRERLLLGNGNAICRG